MSTPNLLPVIVLTFCVFLFFLLYACFSSLKIHSLIAKVSLKFFTWTGVVAASCSKLPWRSRIQLVSSDRAVEFKNNKQKMFQQHLGTVSTTMICFDKSGLCFTIPNESARLKSLRQKVFSTLLPHIMEIYSISEMFRNFIDRFELNLNEKENHFETLCSEFYVKQRTCNSLASFRCWIKFSKLEFHEVMEWIERGWWTEWTAHVAAWLVRMLIACVHFSSFSLWTFVSAPNDETSAVVESSKVLSQLDQTAMNERTIQTLIDGIKYLQRRLRRLRTISVITTDV